MSHPTRREFLASLSATAIGASRFPLRAQTKDVRIDAAKLRQRIEKLSVFGRPAGGTFADGVSRTAYSDADIEGRRFVMAEMTAAGLQPRIDPAGNIFARRASSGTAGAPIVFGSHIDSVPNGGNFDGDLGSLSALAAIEALDAAGVATRHPLEMVVWAHEEGFAFGRGIACSRIVAGLIADGDMDVVWNGMTRGDAIRRIGGDPGRILDARRPKGAHHCYLELHIEQGGTLERSNTAIGVVEGIVAIDRHEALITGFANHAGTTPIAERQDAMLAAAHLTIAVRDAVTKVPGRQVGTVGQIELTPNSPNVIPGRARLSIELRDLSSQKLVRDHERHPRAGARNRGVDANDDRVHHRDGGRGSGRHAGSAAGDRAGRGVVGAQRRQAAERGRTRRAEHGAHRADGDDFRAQRRRRQPFAERADPLGRLRAWRRRAAADDSRDGSPVGTAEGDGLEGRP